MIHPGGGTKTDPSGWYTETIYPTRQRLFAYSHTLNLRGDVQWCTPPGGITSKTGAAALAIKGRRLSSSCRHRYLGVSSHLDCFLREINYHFLCGMGLQSLAFLDNHSRVGDPSTSIFLHGIATVACIPVLNRPRWQRKCPLLRGSSTNSLLFFLGCHPPFIAFILADKSSFFSVSACLSSKICFLVLVTSPTSGPPGKVAGGVTVIFERRGGCCYPPALLKNYC